MSSSTLIVKHNRIHAVAEAFKELGMEGVQIFEDHDPQMIVAKEIHSICGKICVAILAVNALVSYMLEMKGEEYWNSLTEYVRVHGCPEDLEDVINVIERFTASRNRRFLNVKLMRLRRLRTCPDVIRLSLMGDLRAFRSGIVKCLGSSPEAKTIVFSVKMAYYGLRASGEKLSLPKDLPIPVDFRVSYVTYLSQMISVKTGMPKDAVKVLMSKPKVVRKVWDDVSRLSRIPPLSLDAPVWVTGRYVDLGRKSLVINALQKLGVVEEVGEVRIRRLINELLYLLPD